MIGDIVLNNGTPRKVQQLTKRKIGYHIGIMDCNMHYVRLHDIEPIRITNEILEKNDFVLKEVLHQYRWSVLYDNIHIMSKIKFEYEVMVNGFPHKIEYVHELQHILHFIGYNNLAENFKI